MSGAEALAVFGIACNVMQVIGFVKDGIEIGKAIYETGSLDNQLAQTTSYITESLERLRDLLGNVRPLGKEEQELLDIAQGSIDTATELKAELDKISSTMAKGKHTAAIRGWLRAATGGSKRIKKIEKVMRDRQQILETRLLFQICNKNDAILIQQQSDFDKLDGILQDFIEARSRNETALLRLIQDQSAAVNVHMDNKTKGLAQSFKAVFFSQSSQMQDNISSKLQDLAIHQTSKEERERFTESFRFETMNARRNRISTNHDDTFSWVFNVDDVGSDADSRQDSMLSPSDAGPKPGEIGFLQWLQASQQRPYWISGKAGSGKSTLMKFLAGHPNTKSILDESNGTTIILSHFLWAVGDPLERNMEGTLCTLIYQLLCKEPELSGKVLERFSEQRQNRFPADWSTEQLLAVAVFIFSASTQHICIFLDGLDETGTQEGQTGLTGLLDKLCAISQIQICVSSRPEPVFYKYFSSCPQLRVQDLTQFDIKKYTMDTLQGLYLDDTEELTSLVNTICLKTDGVFLWVALALKSIQAGHCNDDDPSELVSRLEALPSDLNTLYQQMWRCLNDSEVVYRNTAAKYFNLALECISSLKVLRTSNLIIMALALNPRLAAPVVTDDIESLADELDMECERISKRLLVRCAGLLEVSEGGNVTFIHRSAQEFLVNTPQGQQILQADQVPGETRLLNLARTGLAQT